MNEATEQLIFSKKRISNPAFNCPEFGVIENDAGVNQLVVQEVSRG